MLIQAPSFLPRTHLLSDITFSLFVLLIPFSTSITLGLTFLLPLLWGSKIKSMGFDEIFNFDVVKYPFCLFVVLVFSGVYSVAPLNEVISTLGKYRELLFPLLLIPFLQTARQQKWAERSMIAALIFILLASYLDKFALLPDEISHKILKSRITHGLFMAFLGFYSTHRFLTSEDIKNKFFWAITWCLVFINVFFICDGRTGQLVYIFLMLLVLFQSFRPRFALLFGVFFSLIAFLAIIFNTTNRFREGVVEIAGAYHNNHEAQNTSMGYRYKFWTHSLEVIKAHPILGVGVGGLPYANMEIHPDEPLMQNPHNEFLLIWAQSGLIGLCLLLFSIYKLLIETLSMKGLSRSMSQGVLTALIVTSLLNSPLLDHFEGHWFMFLLSLYFAKIQNTEEMMV